MKLFIVILRYREESVKLGSLEYGVSDEKAHMYQMLLPGIRGNGFKELLSKVYGGHFLHGGNFRRRRLFINRWSKLGFTLAAFRTTSICYAK